MAQQVREQRERLEQGEPATLSEPRAAESETALDPQVAALLRDVNTGPLLPAAGDAGRSDDDAFSTIMHLLASRVESLKRGEVVFSTRVAL